LAIGLLAWLLFSGRLDFARLREIRHTGYLFAAVATLVALLGLQAFRWFLLLGLQRLPVRPLMAVRLYWLGQFANFFLPGATGGDLAKAYAVCRHLPEAKTRAVSTVFMDRAFGVHSLFTVGSTAGVILLLQGPYSGKLGVLLLAILCLFAATAGLSMLLWRRTSALALRLLPGRIRGSLASSLELYRHSPRRLLGVWLVSCVCSLFGITAYCLVAAALGVAISLEQVLAVPLVMAALSLPFTPGGLGIGETIGSELYATFGVADGALIVLLVRLLIVVVSLPGMSILLTGLEPRETGYRLDTS
jgi:uncharacterized membrane protein YbhN (UPF0104 family)